MTLTGGRTLIGFGDYNADGEADLVEHDASGYAWIALGNGDGSFEAPAWIGGGGTSLDWHLHA